MRVEGVYRGRFSRWDPTRPTASAIAVSNGRVVALDDEAESLASDARVKEDFGELPVFPGFHDAHCHTTGYGLGLGELDLSSPPICSLEDLYGAVAARSADLAPGAWLVGSGYDQNKIGGSHPERRRLDEVARGRPVWLRHTSGHMCVVSSATFELIGEAARNPIEGGAVERDTLGEPTGLLEERAQGLVHALVLPRSIESLVEAIGAAHERYLSEGLTSVCDAGIAGGWIGQSPIELAAYQAARDAGLLKVRSTVMISSDVLSPVAAHARDCTARSLDAGIRSGLGDEWLRIGPLKIFADGSLIGRTCWMEHEFADDPGNTGYPQDEPAALRQMIIDAHLAGWQVATHAIGDAAVSFVLEALEEALGRKARHDHRHRIEHCGVTTPQALDHIARLGVVPVPQGRFVGEIGDGMLAALGEARTGHAYRLRSFLEAGIPLPGSSDRPVVDGRPLLGIKDMAVRRTESGRPFAPGEA
ncbi:MAG: amidohydrolase, partial [Acidimicrobiales bacterium]